ncbi:hypothetical protein TRIP_D420073 [uncultured Paludibacter sp.]|nr:hypothetical protein TRIP_D420073 [uncultured Paludibacter sp.]
MRKPILIVLTLFFLIQLSAQDYSNKFDYKLGAGLGFMGNGDLTTVTFENEVTYKLNKYFSSAISFEIGRSIKNMVANNDYLERGINVFISPFKNNRRNNFKIGGGYSYINTSSTYIGAVYYIPNYEVKYVYEENSYNAFNIIIEDEYKINSRFLVGLKAYTIGNMDQGGILSGGMVKFGIAL